MGILKNFIDELTKHKLLAYFVTLWGAMLFLRPTYGFITYGLDMGYSNMVLGTFDVLFHLSELFAGVLLLIVGIKVMNANFLKTIKSEKILIYFLLLWAASFFFLGLYNIIDHGPRIFEHWNSIIAFLSGLAALIAGVVLGLFSWKLLNETE